MKAPLDWLKGFVDIKIPAIDLAERLTMSGVEAMLVDNGTALEIDVLPNRGDCNSIFGIAREMSAIISSKLKSKNLKLKENQNKISSVLKVEVRDQKLCQRYMARVVENVTVKDSPKWLKDRITACGLRPINNVVDVTNYLLLELGQPMHAFDYNEIQGHRIIVRRASKDEKVKTLDGAEYMLDKDCLVIADANRTIAIAGIKGCANTEVLLKTKTVVLESAYFDPISVSKTSKHLKLRTESSVRFEKTVDWNMVEIALDCAAIMIAELSNGNVLKGKYDIKGKIFKQKALELRIDRLSQVLGITIPAETIIKILKGLGFAILKKFKNSLKVLVPSWRFSDIEREIDLVEEVARIYGYQNIPATNPKIRMLEVGETQNAQVSQIKDILFGCGLYEVQTFSIVDPDESEEGAIKITNPMTITESTMRTSLLPSILKVVSYNIRHQVDDIRIFEVGKVFRKKERERLVLGGALFYPNADFYDVKGIIEALLSQHSNNFSIESLSDQWYFPGRSAAAIVENRPVAKLGLLHPGAKKKYDLHGDILIFEVDIEILIGIRAVKKHFALPKYPKVDRDVAVFVPEGVTYPQIISVIKETAGILLEEVKLFDVYKNSQAYRLSFRDRNSTLIDEVVNEVFAKVIKALEDKLKVQIRK